MKRGITKTILISLVACSTYVALLIFPEPLFTKKYSYKNFDVYSDRPISDKIELVIDDAIKRLDTSELYKSSQKFNLFLCNDHWRFMLFGRNGNAGGIVNFLISPNVFLRENDLTKNSIFPPKSWKNDLSDRPLSYFVAHEVVHVLQRNYDSFLIFKVPEEILEGYAEYISKSPSRNLAKLKIEFKNSSPKMNPANGLYDKYNLFITILVEQKGYTFEKIIKEKPKMDAVLAEMNVL